MRPILILPVILVSACAPDVPVPVSKLAAPSARVMAKPEPLAELPEGASIYTDAAQCRSAYGRETAKLQSLQGYVRTIRRDAPQ